MGTMSGFAYTMPGTRPSPHTVAKVLTEGTALLMRISRNSDTDVSLSDSGPVELSELAAAVLPTFPFAFLSTAQDQ